MLILRHHITQHYNTEHKTYLRHVLHVIMLSVVPPISPIQLIEIWRNFEKKMSLSNLLLLNNEMIGDETARQQKYQRLF